MSIGDYANEKKLCPSFVGSDVEPAHEVPPRSGAAPPVQQLSGTSLVVGRFDRRSSDEVQRQVDADKIPDALSAEAAIGAEYVDQQFVRSRAGRFSGILERLPAPVIQAVAVLLWGSNYDVVLTWSDLPSMLVAAVLRLRRRRPAHVAILLWPSRRRSKAWLLRLLQADIDRFIIPSPMQRAFATRELGITPERIVESCAQVDTRFWNREAVSGTERQMACAVGREMRDYGTLLEALRTVEIPFHIATGSGEFHANQAEADRPALAESQIPPNVSIGRKSFTELRALYGRSRFAVIPLIPSDNDSGITAILESFAMGLAVIVTDSPGQTGVLKHGVNCLRVPPQDPAALAAAIRRLWEDPALCARLGANGRDQVQRRHSLECWTATLVRAADEARSART